MAQFPLDLGHETALTREDFLVSACNEQAMGWVDRWPNWTATALILYGAPSSGKTHLLHIWAKRAKAVLFSAKDLSSQGLDRAVGHAQAVAVDDIEALVKDKSGEEALFHLYNLMRERNGYLLLTAMQPAARMDWQLADLRSRLLASETVGIGLPDDALVAALLVKLFADRQLRVSEEVVRYVSTRIKRSFAAVQSLVEQLDHLSLAGKRPVTIALARQILED